MSIRKEFVTLSKKYQKKIRPITLKQACLMSIQKWEEVINIVIKNEEDYDNDLLCLNYESCGLCKFFEVTDKDNVLCYKCPLKRCGNEYSLYQRTMDKKTADMFIYNAYKLIKKIRKKYKQITGEVLRSDN